MDKKLAIRVADLLYEIEECTDIIDSVKGFVDSLETSNKEILAIFDETTSKLKTFIQKKEEELRNL